MELGQGIGEVGRLAQSAPEDAAVEGLEDFFVVSEGGGQGGFAEAAGNGEGGGDRHRILALPLQQQASQRLELLGALNEADRQVRGHEGHPGWIQRKRAVHLIDQGRQHRSYRTGGTPRISRLQDRDPLLRYPLSMRPLISPIVRADTSR